MLNKYYTCLTLVIVMQSFSVTNKAAHQ